jgi:hypothetical protein
MLVFDDERCALSIENVELHEALLVTGMWDNGDKRKRYTGKLCSAD